MTERACDALRVYTEHRADQTRELAWYWACSEHALRCMASVTAGWRATHPQMTAWLDNRSMLAMPAADLVAAFHGDPRTAALDRYRAVTLRGRCRYYQKRDLLEDAADERAPGSMGANRDRSWRRDVLQPRIDTELVIVARLDASDPAACAAFLDAFEHMQP